MDACPGRLDLTTVTLLRAGIGKQLGLEHGIGHFLGQRPGQAGSLEASDRRPNQPLALPLSTASRPINNGGTCSGMPRRSRAEGSALRASRAGEIEK